jgi:hypothetical protein
MKNDDIRPLFGRSKTSWIARVLGLLLIGLPFVVAVVKMALGQSNAFGFGTLFALVPFIVAWWHEGIGGVSLIIAGLAIIGLGFVAAHGIGIEVFFLMIIAAGPYMLIGLLFLLSWNESRKMQRGVQIYH